MVGVFFFHGLAFFVLGLTTLLETRRGSNLYLGRQLPWMAAFGMTQSLVEWSEMFLLVYPEGRIHDLLSPAHIVLLPVSALILIRFGIGLIGEGGPLPAWLAFAPIALLVPLGLLTAYAVIVILTMHSVETSVDVWGSYLFYFPGCVLAVVGFLREWRGLPKFGLGEANRLMLGAAIAFGFDALVAGLIVPPAPYGLAPWLNTDLIQEWTGASVQIWRALAGIGVMFFVIRAYRVFEVESDLRLDAMHAAREREQEQARELAEEWTDGLVGVNRHIANWENVDTTLVGIVGLARTLLTADSASLGLWDSTGTRLDLKCYALANESKTVGNLTVDHQLINTVARTGASIRYPDDVQAIDSLWICPVVNREILAGAIVPLKLEDQPVGAMWVGRYEAKLFTAADVIGLERLADNAVIALEHAAMGARLQSLAVTDERGRIAREMHDGLAQILGYLSVQMQTLESLAQQGKGEAMLRELRQARERISHAQSDVRENILSLRTTLDGEAALVPALREYVEEFGIQTGITAKFFSAVEDTPPLSPIAETQLVRIVQEALTNTRKHAHANCVQVSLQREDDELQVTVLDDGIGMNLDGSKYHFGLQTMRERAESVSGRITIESTVGQGTRVQITMPLLLR